MKGTPGYFRGALRITPGHTDGPRVCGVHQNLKNLKTEKHQKKRQVYFLTRLVWFSRVIFTINF